MPSTSAHPGADHKGYWGAVLPKSDPFGGGKRDCYECRKMKKSMGELQSNARRARKATNAKIRQDLVEWVKTQLPEVMIGGRKAKRAVEEA